jgi:hypothetical protein
MGGRPLARQLEPAQPRQDAQRREPDPAAAGCLVPRLPRDPVVDRAARAEGLAVLDMPSARASAARGCQAGRGGRCAAWLVDRGEVTRSRH